MEAAWSYETMVPIRASHKIRGQSSIQTAALWVENEVWDLPKSELEFVPVRIRCSDFPKREVEFVSVRIRCSDIPDEK